MLLLDKKLEKITRGIEFYDAIEVETNYECDLLAFKALSNAQAKKGSMAVVLAQLRNEMAL